MDTTDNQSDKIKYYKSINEPEMFVHHMCVENNCKSRMKHAVFNDISIFNDISLMQIYF